MLEARETEIQCDSNHCGYTVNRKRTGEIDLEVWYARWGRYWTAEERREYEEEVLNEWLIKHGRSTQVKLF